MRSGIWAVATAVVVLSGCAAAPDPGSTPVTESAPESRPWDVEGLPGFYMVSTEIQEYCPNGEEYLGGGQITEAIPAQAFDELDGYACVFAAPASGAANEVDEFAYRVDEGLGDLIRAYAATTYASEGECTEEISIDALYPHVRVEYEGVGYTVTVAGCGDAAALDEAVDGLRVTEVARDTATAEEAEEQGL